MIPHRRGGLVQVTRHRGKTIDARRDEFRILWNTFVTVVIVHGSLDIDCIDQTNVRYNGICVEASSTTQSCDYLGFRRSKFPGTFLSGKRTIGCRPSTSFVALTVSNVRWPISVQL